MPIATLREQIKGRAAENFFINRVMCRERWENDLWPRWLIGIRRATQEEDKNGIDFFAETRDAGEIPIQIKSSSAGAKTYKEKHSGKNRTVCIVIIGENELLGDVFRKTRKALGLARHQILNGKQQEFILA